MGDIAIKAPFPWFGGKSRCAHLVWPRFGDVGNYCEPFFGSGAMLWARPENHTGTIETVNDIDGFVANFWRSVQADSDAVAQWATNPVNEIDLEARHRWLCRQPDKQVFLDTMKHDPDYFDVKRAGWWVWGICSWIGSGWCSGNYYPENHNESNGRCVCKDANKLPHIGRGRGVDRQLPHLGNNGRGVNRQQDGDREQWLREWFGTIQARLANVRVCCGDWKSICTDGALHAGSIKGVFLDPPYASKREAGVYSNDSFDVAHEVREWAIANGDRENIRIALCGYEGEHVMPDSWECVAWKALGGYGSFAEGDTQGKANAHKERIWFSPHCLKEDSLNNFELK